MNKKTITIIAAAVTVLGLIIAGIALALSDFDFTFKKSSDSADSKKIYTKEQIDSFHSIEIDSGECEIEFVPCAGDDRQVEVIDADCKVKVEQGVLKITQNEEKNKWYEYIWNFNDKKITISMPESKYESIDIKVSSGDVEMPDNFTFEQGNLTASSGDIKFGASVTGALNVITSSGDIELDSVSAESFNLNAPSGEIKMRSAETAGEMVIGTSSGDVELRSVNCGRLEIETTSGEQKLKNVVAKGELWASSTSGDISADRCDGEDVIFETTSGDVKGKLLSEKKFSTETSSGDVDIPQSGSGNCGSCTVTTTSGDIEIGLA